MEDLSPAPGSPAVDYAEEPQGNNDPGDPLQPSIDEEDTARTPPIGEPTADMDANGDDEAPETVAAMTEDAEDADDKAAGSDDESDLEELDDAQFAHFDPAAINVPDAAPIAVDESNVGQLGVHKRKRTEEEERERKKKKKEGRREKKPKERKKRREEDEPDFEGGPEMDGKRGRKSKASGGESRPRVRREKTPEDLDSLDPEERRRRALEAKMDLALATNKPRARKGIDLDRLADNEIDDMRKRMAEACEKDSIQRQNGQIASHKITLLPEVVELMNRNQLQNQLVDPDINILEAVRFMLEPSDTDAALPNFQIQRQLFAILTKLPMTKEALIASGIGKVVGFYTKSRQPEPSIKRQADRLMGEWTRIVLNKRKDLRGKHFKVAQYDSTQRPSGSSQVAANRAAVIAEKRRKALAAPAAGNRARVEGGVGTYTIAPQNNVTAALGAGQRLGGGGDERFKKIAQRAQGKAGRR